MFNRPVCGNKFPKMKALTLKNETILTCDECSVHTRSSKKSLSTISFLSLLIILPFIHVTTDVMNIYLFSILLIGGISIVWLLTIVFTKLEIVFDFDKPSKGHTR